ncbi:MAG: DICT sensory domain-containing protein [Cyanobacteria bacterium P01_H01_bin.105]
MDISLFRSIAGQYDTLRSTRSVNMMNVISQQIEDQVLQHRMAVDFYAGFQRFSNFPEQLRRYGRLGSICRRVYVFGIPDCEPPSIQGVEFIELSPTSALAQEWFLFVDTPNFWATLVAQESENPAAPGGRHYDGLWSYDEAVVDRISLLMSQVMESIYQPVKDRDHSKQYMHIAEINSRMLGLIEQTDTVSQRRWQQLRTLHGVADIVSTSPSKLLHSAAITLQAVFGAASVAIAFKLDDDYYTVPVLLGEVNGKGRKIPLSRGISGQVICQGRLAQIRDTNQRSELDALMPMAKSLIAAPLVCRRISGALIIGATESNQWNDEDAKTLLAVAQIISMQFEQLLVKVKNTNGKQSLTNGAHKDVSHTVELV